jgi:hypothetical protein
MMEKVNRRFVAVSAILLVTLVNYTIYLTSENSRLTHMVQLSDTRSDINQEWANEITHVMINKLNDNHEEGMRSQGRMEGIVDYLTKPEDYQSVWHEGYQRGLNQSEEMARIEKEEDDNAPFDRPINPDAIKKPDFDKNIEKVQDGGGE